MENFIRDLPDIDDVSWMDQSHAPDIGQSRVRQLKSSGDLSWLDGMGDMNLLDETDGKPTEELLNLNWRSDMEEYGGRSLGVEKHRL